MLKLVLSVYKHNCAEHYEHQEVTLEDGERISVDWFPKKARNMDPKIPIIITMPGITSDSSANYINTFAGYAVSDYKFRVAVMNRRGYRGMPFMKKEVDPVTWNKFGDLDAVIASVKSQFPDANIYLAGLSMGANHIQKFAGMKGKDGISLPIKALGCISSPYCLKVTTKVINSGFVLKTAMAKTLKETFSDHLHCKNFQKALKSKNIDPKVVLAAGCSDEFNRVFSMRFTDYKTLDCYKEAVSSVGYIRHIKVPTIAVNVKTDPISPYSAIPFGEIAENPNYIQYVANGGGHLEYFSGLKMRRWGFDLILAYFGRMEADLQASEVAACISK